jgi:hypothetical protein
MKVLQKGIMPNGTPIQIEEWRENYSFVPYGATIGSYPKSKVSHEGAFAPKGNVVYRFAFEFDSGEEAETAFKALLEGNKALADYRENLQTKKYADCI